MSDKSAVKRGRFGAKVGGTAFLSAVEDATNSMNDKEGVTS